MKKKTKPLKPIGSGSRAEDIGYDIDLLIGWLEDIKDHEFERAESDPRYMKRAELFEDGLSKLQSASEMQ